MPSQDDPLEGGFELLAKFPGSALVGLNYTPLFNYFTELAHKAFRVVSDNYVTDSSGTGIVHQAPAFGEDDFRVCIAHGIVERSEVGSVCPVDLNGCFEEVVSDFKGL